MRYVTASVWVILVLCTVPAIAGEADDLAREGTDALALGNYEQAVEMLLAAVEKEKDHAAANTALLRLYLVVGDYEQAAENVAQLCARNAATAEIMALGGDALASKGEYEKALELYRKGVATDEGNVHSHLGTSRILKMTGESKEAEKHFEKGRRAYLDHSEHTAEEMAYAASICTELNRYSEANSILGDAVAKFPESVDVLVLRARIFLEKYDYPYAKELYDTALGKNPKHPETLTGLAWVYDRIDQLGPERFAKARSYARKALRTNRSYDDAYLYLACSELTDGNYARAKSYLEKALETNSRSTPALAVLAAIAKLRSDEDRYKQIRDKAFKLPGMKAEFLHGVASILQTRFRYQEALELSEAALKTDETYWPAYATAGLNLMRLGREKEAKPFLEKSRDNDPFNVWTYNSLQLLMHMSDNFKEKKTADLVIKMHGAEFDILLPYVEQAAERSYEVLSRKYKFKPKSPVVIELFRKHEYFSARTVGLPGIAAAGACFGPLVTMDSPSARRPGTYNWAKTLHHEMAHAITLQRSGNRISRWFGEGISVYEEKMAYPHWGRNMERAFIDGMRRGDVTPISQLEKDFNKPRNAADVLLAYYHSSLIVEFIAEKYGFEKILAILDLYATGKDDEDIFTKALSVTTEKLDTLFIDWAKEHFGKFKVPGRITASDVSRLRDETEFAPDNPAAYARLARAYLAAGKILDAETSAKRAIRLDDSNPETFIALAELDIQQGFGSSAKENYLKSLAADLENDYDVHIVLSRLYLAEDKKEEAIEHLERAIAVFPRDISAVSPYRLLYAIYSQQEEKEKSLEQVRKIVSLTDGELDMRVLLADTLLEEHEYEEASEILRQVMDLSPLIPGTHERLGDALLGDELYDDALTEYKAAIVVGASDQAHAYSGIAECYFHKEDTDQAEKNARKALELDATNQRARQVLELIGKWSE